MDDQQHTNEQPWLFGGPLTAEQHERFNASLGPLHLHHGATSATARISRTIDLRARDWHIARLAGRLKPNRPMPTKLVPGDVSAIRLLSTFAMVPNARTRIGDAKMIDAKAWANTPEAFGYAQTAVNLYEAVPYWMDLDTAIGIGSSRPPDPEILNELRLPFDAVAVFFNRPMHVEVDEGDLPRLAGDWSQHTKHGIVPLLGVVVHARPGGVGLHDYCLFIGALLNDGGPPTPSSGVALLPGDLSRATLQPLVANLAAAVGYGRWREPGEMPEAIIEAGDSPEGLAKAFKKGAVRSRAEPRGALTRVWVLDSNAMTQPSRPPQGGTHASPVAHMRRGHWRRTRVGPRDEWWYETRWIPPTVVNAGSKDEVRRVAVYRHRKSEVA